MALNCLPNFRTLKALGRGGFRTGSRGRSHSLRGGLVPMRAGDPQASGSSTVKVVPFPGSLSTVIAP